MSQDTLYKHKNLAQEMHYSLYIKRKCHIKNRIRFTELSVPIGMATVFEAICQHFTAKAFQSSTNVEYGAIDDVIRQKMLTRLCSGPTHNNNSNIPDNNHIC